MVDYNFILGMLDNNNQIHKQTDPAKIRNATNMVSVNRLAFGGRGGGQWCFMLDSSRFKHLMHKNMCGASKKKMTFCAFMKKVKAENINENDTTKC